MNSAIQRINSNARRVAVASQGSSSSGSSSSSSSSGLLKKLPFSVLTVLESVDDMVRRGIVTAQRPNPKQRKKLMNRMKTGGGSGGDYNKAANSNKSR